MRRHGRHVKEDVTKRHRFGNEHAYVCMYVCSVKHLLNPTIPLRTYYDNDHE